MPDKERCVLLAATSMLDVVTEEYRYLAEHPCVCGGQWEIDRTTSTANTGTLFCSCKTCNRKKEFGFRWNVSVSDDAHNNSIINTLGDVLAELGREVDPVRANEKKRVECYADKKTAPRTLSDYVDAAQKRFQERHQTATIDFTAFPLRQAKHQKNEINSTPSPTILADEDNKNEDKPAATLLDSSHTQENSGTNNIASTQFMESESGRHSTNGGAREYSSGLVGRTLIDDYIVEKELGVGQGAMGIVYLVRRKSDDTLYAVKTANQKTSENRLALYKELLTWIDLGKQRNITQCYFLRTSRDRLYIFAEYIDGGSLHDWIESKRLYEGTEDQVLLRILDIAIQTAWGLHVAHCYDTLHLDIKPGNILLTKDGIPKLTDFGLAKIKQVVKSGDKEGITEETIRRASGGTPSYSSPEQSQGKLVSSASDLWSWGVTILEMFTGKCHWKTGQAASLVLDSVVGNERKAPHLPRMTQEIEKVLRKCFLDKPEDRWGILYASKAFEEIYRELSSENTYPYDMPPVQKWERSVEYFREGRAGVMWDSGKFWVELVQNEFDDFHIETSKWEMPSSVTKRAKLVADLAIFDEVKAVLSSKRSELFKELEKEYGELCLQKGWIHCELGDYSGALVSIDEAEKAFEHITCTTEEGDSSNVCAIEFAKATISEAFNDWDNARKHYEKAVNDSEIAVQQISASRRNTDVAVEAHINAASCCLFCGDLERALKHINRSFGLRLPFAKKDPSSVAGFKNVTMCSLKAEILHQLADVEKAIEFYDMAVYWYASNAERKPEEITPYLTHSAAGAIANKSLLLKKQGRVKEALKGYQNAIGIFETLSRKTGRPEFENIVAGFTASEANVLWMHGKLDAARSRYDRAIFTRKKLVYEYGLFEYENDLAEVYSNKARLLVTVNNLREAGELLDQAIDIRERVSEGSSNWEHLHALANTYKNRAVVLENEKKYDLAIQRYEKSRQCFLNVSKINRNWDVLDSMAAMYHDYGWSLFKNHQLNEAIESASEAIAIRESLESKLGNQDLSLGRAAARRAFYRRENSDWDAARRDARYAKSIVDRYKEETERKDVQALRDWIERHLKNLLK